MNKHLEIERKFLVDMEKLLEFDEYNVIPYDVGYEIRQGYINDGLKTVRIRTNGKTGYITIKGPKFGTSCFEAEYDIGLEEANTIIDTLDLPVVEKIRCEINNEGHLWELDWFFGDNKGLLVAEVELTSEDEDFALPEWIGIEVTGDAKYYNSNLIDNPYKDWDEFNEI